MHAVNTFRRLDMERAETLKMANSHAGLVPTNKQLPLRLFFATSHVKSRPSIKVGYRIKGRVRVINGYALFVFPWLFHVSFN